VGLDDLITRLLAAEAALAAGDMERGSSMARHVEVLARRRAQPRVLGWALLLRARSCHFKAAYESAYAAALEASTLLLASGDIARALRAQNTLVAVHRENQDLVRAAEQARRGIDLAVAHGEHEMTVRLLHSLAHVLHNTGEYPEAIRCLQRALTLHAAQPQALPCHQQRCAADLAWAHLNYAEQLAQQGQTSESDAQFLAARRALAVPSPLVGVNSADAIACLAQRVHLFAVWQQRSFARASAAALLKLARRRGPQREMALAFDALSTLHLCAGQARRASQQQLRSLGILRQMRFIPAVHTATQRLADIYARSAAYTAALRWQREAVALRARAAVEQGALRERVARLEHQAGRRHNLAFESQQHAQRILVLGRLIGQLHLALLRPLQRTQQRVEQTLDALSRQADVAQVLAPLQRALTQIDLAAALGQQLKLFSFRAAPQSSLLALDEALRSAWDGLALYGRLRGWSLGLVDSVRQAQPLEAQADAQRLGILLKTLLITMTQAQPARAAYSAASGQVLWAQLRSDAPHTVALVLGVSGHRGLALGVAGAHALCTELATEMGGHLSVELEGTLPRSYRLTLPRAARLAALLDDAL
jgi:tetratricopeptide (TPR) repeat protein